MEKYAITAPDRGRCRCTEQGFSLIEVALAVGILATAIVGIFALLPTGMNIFRTAMDTSVGSQIIQRVLNEAQQSDFDALMAGSTRAVNETFLARNPLDPARGTVRWFDDQANELTSAAQAVYHVNTRIMPATALPTTGTNPANNINLATITIQVANNPGNRSLAFEEGGAADPGKPLRNLWSGAYASQPTAKIVSLVTASSIIPRNR